jgi:hypothetical protein
LTFNRDFSIEAFNMTNKRIFLINERITYGLLKFLGLKSIVIDFLIRNTQMRSIVNALSIFY